MSMKTFYLFLRLVVCKSFTWVWRYCPINRRIKLTLAMHKMYQTISTGENIFTKKIKIKFFLNQNLILSRVLTWFIKMQWRQRSFFKLQGNIKQIVNWQFHFVSMFLCIDAFESFIEIKIWFVLIYATTDDNILVFYCSIPVNNL